MALLLLLLLLPHVCSQSGSCYGWASHAAPLIAGRRSTGPVGRLFLTVLRRW